MITTVQDLWDCATEYISNIHAAPCLKVVWHSSLQTVSQKSAQQSRYHLFVASNLHVQFKLCNPPNNLHHNVTWECLAQLWQSHLLSHPVVPLRVAFSRNLRSLFWPRVVFEGAAVLGEHIEAKRGGDFGWHLGPPCSARLIQSSHQGGLRDHLNLQAGASKLVGELRSLRLVTYNPWILESRSSQTLHITDLFAFNVPLCSISFPG